MKNNCCLNKKDCDEVKELSLFLKIISEKNRLKILYMLDKEKCVCEIWKNLDLAQNLTSSHLKILRKSGLINSRKEGLNVYYSLNKENIRKYNKLLKQFIKKYE